MESFLAKWLRCHGLFHLLAPLTAAGITDVKQLGELSRNDIEEICGNRASALRRVMFVLRKPDLLAWLTKNNLEALHDQVVALGVKYPVQLLEVNLGTLLRLSRDLVAAIHKEHRN